MSWPDYELDDLSPSTPMGAVMYDFARRRPRRASRLLDAMDDFANVPLSTATLVAPRQGNPPGNPQGKEIYLVPQQYTFLTVSDAAALVLIDHPIEKMSVLEIIEDYQVDPNQPLTGNGSGLKLLPLSDLSWGPTQLL